MFPRLVLALSLVAMTIAACGDATPTVGEAKAFAAACDKANDGKRIAVEGYLLLPDSFTDSQSVVLRMYESDAFSGTPIGVQMRFGTGANQLEEVPNEYTDDDLKVHLADGQVVGYTTKVRVSGTVYFPLVEQDFVCGLENPLVEAAP